MGNTRNVVAMLQIDYPMRFDTEQWTEITFRIFAYNIIYITFISILKQ